MIRKTLPARYPLTNGESKLPSPDCNRLTIDEAGLLCSLLNEYRRKLNPSCTEQFLTELSRIECLNKKLNGLLIQALMEEQN
jgi:hypothetical protein